MENKENLHYQEQIALEGEMAFFLSTAPHNEEMLYRVFMLLETAPTKLLPYLISEVKEQTEVKEEVIDLIALQAREKETPVWLWLDRSIADIKQCAEGNELLFNPHKLSINKKVARIKIIKSAFCIFIRRLGLLCYPAAKALISKVLEDEELNYLHGICLVYNDQLEELYKTRVPKKIIGRDILDMSFEPKEILNFNKMLSYREELETEEKENILFQLDEIPQEEEFQVVTSEQMENIKGTLQEIVEQLTKLPEASVEVVVSTGDKYVVNKKQDGYKVMLKVFNTEAEAENYIKEIKEKAPDLKAEFEIKKLGK